MELASFGVRSQELSAERLMAFPEVLWVLYGKETLDTPEALLAAALNVERVIRAFIASIEDPIDRRIAQAFLATTTEFQRKTVEQRKRDLVGKSITPGLYDDRRDVLKFEITAALRRSANLQTLLSPEALDAARQLCKYSHEALIYIEAFDHVTCSLFAAQRQRPEGVHQLLWFELLRDHARVDGYTFESDMSLWLFAHCLKYLQLLQADSSGREYLREHMSVSWWRYQLEIPFDPADILTQLINLEVDQPEALDDALRETSTGEHLCRRWLFFLTGPPRVQPAEQDDRFPYPEGERNSLRTRLVALARFLGAEFPEEVRSRDLVGREFRTIVSHLLPVDPDAAKRSGSEHWTEIAKVFFSAISSRPPVDRYVFGENERVYTEWQPPGSSY
jgi:hypothetical protein